VSVFDPLSVLERRILAAEPTAGSATARATPSDRRGNPG
jgi:hypothetical protein